MSALRRWRRAEGRVPGLVLARRRVRFHFTDRRRPDWVLSVSQYTYTWRVFTLQRRSERASRRFFG